MRTTLKLKTINARPEKAYNMEHGITDKSKTSILTLAQKQTRKEEKRLHYLNNVEDI